jgi:hypothetical protein
MSEDTEDIEKLTASLARDVIAKVEPSFPLAIDRAHAYGLLAAHFMSMCQCEMVESAQRLAEAASRTKQAE